MTRFALFKIYAFKWLELWELAVYQLFRYLIQVFDWWSVAMPEWTIGVIDSMPLASVVEKSIQSIGKFFEWVGFLRHRIIFLFILKNNGPQNGPPSPQGRPTYEPWPRQPKFALWANVCRKRFQERYRREKSDKPSCLRPNREQNLILCECFHRQQELACWRICHKRSG